VTNRPETWTSHTSAAVDPDSVPSMDAVGGHRVPYRLWIGVTGHRRIADVEGVRAAIREVIGRVATQVPRSDDTPVQLGVISPLAEGADRLVAQAVLEQPDAVLEAALPLPVDEYLRDFGTEESREEFRTLLGRARQVTEMFPTDSREHAYKQVGEYVVDRCDVLITVRNREHVGGTGGTEETYRYAIGKRRPELAVYVIDPERPAVVQQSLPDQDWPHGWAEIDRFNKVPISAAALTAEVDHQRDRLLRIGADAGLGQANVRPFLDWSLPHLVRADLLATRSRHRYMAAGNIVFGTTFVAVMIAAAQAIYHVPAFSVVEFAVMAFLLGAILWGRHRHLHGHWLAYRSLAERFRTALFRTIAGLDSRREVSRGIRAVDPFRPWDDRLFEEVWAGRPREHVESPDPVALRAFLLTAWVDDQCRYHMKAVTRYRNRDRVVRGLIYGIVGVALAVAFLHVVRSPLVHLWPTESDHAASGDGTESLLLLISAAAPALRMATAGVRERREYHRIAENSRHTHHYLVTLRPCLAVAPDLASIQGFADRLGQHMLQEVKDWYSTMRSHDFEVQI
jgi:hypothetical protein